LCSEGEIVVDDSIHRGQRIHWKQHESSTQTVNGITGHSYVPVEEDVDSSEVRIHTIQQMCSCGSPSAIDIVSVPFVVRISSGKCFNRKPAIIDTTFKVCLTESAGYGKLQTYSSH
jgi:hypothetical protein